MRTDSPPRDFDDVRLPAWFRWPTLAGLVAVFLFGGERPAWHDPFDLDHAIWLSYAPIIPLVVVGLWWANKLSIKTVFLNVMEMVASKFAITYLIAIPLWATFEPPPAAAAPRPRPRGTPTPASLGPTPTPWPAPLRATVRGHVTSGAADVLVYVSAGLEELAFARDDRPRTIAFGGASELLVVRKWQPLAARSVDGELHALHLEDEGHVLRSMPLLPAGDPAPLNVHDVDGVVSLRCAVHHEHLHLLVLHHPFATTTAEDGSFALEGVPALPLTLTAWRPGHEARHSITPVAGATSDVTLAMERLDPGS